MADIKGLESISEKEYIGRMISSFRTPDGYKGMAYAVTARSPPSKARKLVIEKSGLIRTVVTKAEVLEQGSPILLLYPCIAPLGDILIASNGLQTELLYSTFKNYMQSSSPTRIRELILDAHEIPCWRYDSKDDRWIDLTTFEPDPHNNTPRISAVMQGNVAFFYIVRNKPGDITETVKESDLWSVKLANGQGEVLATYKGGNEKPNLLPFVGEPLKVEIRSNRLDDIAENFYEAIHGGRIANDNFRVAVAVTLFNGTGYDSKVINRSERGE